MAYPRRKKGGQRLMEMAAASRKRGEARRKAASKKKAAAKPKSTAAGRNRTALRTPKSAGSVSGRSKNELPPMYIAMPTRRKMKGGEDLTQRSGTAKKSPYKTTPKQPSKKTASKKWPTIGNAVMRADNPTLKDRARRFAEKLFPKHMGMEPHAPSMGDAAFEVGKRAAGVGALKAARAIKGADLKKLGQTAKDMIKSATAQVKRRPMPKVSAEKVAAAKRNQKLPTTSPKARTTTPKPRNAKAADQKQLERKQQAGVKGARSKAAEERLKNTKGSARTVSKGVLSRASSKSIKPKYKSTARPTAAKKKTAAAKKKRKK